MTLSTDTESEILVITDPERDRYASMRLVPWWDQAKLTAAQVMVVGAGALGNEVLKNLALLGIGRVLIVDLDHIEISNLSRSVLFRQTDQGLSKALVASQRLRDLNPEIEAIPFHGDVTSDIGLGVFRRMDVILGCLDNREARWSVNRICWRLQKPWIDGGLDTLSGSVKVFVPPQGACYECGLTDQDLQMMTWRNSCPGIGEEDLQGGRIPTTITTAAVIAGIQVQEAIKIIHGLEVSPGRGFIYSGVDLAALTVALAPRKECPAHETYQPIVELPVGASSLTLRALLDIARERLGEGAWISLDRQLVVRWTCPECNHTEVAMRPFRSPVVSHCQICGAMQFPDLTHVIREETPGLDIALSELGVPPLHIIELRNGDRAVYVELHGDLNKSMVFRPGD